MSTSTEIQEFMMVAMRLISIMQQECKVVKQDGLEGLDALLEEKMHLSKAYEKGVAYIALNREMMSALPEDEKTAIKELMQAFSETCLENAKVLKAARDSRRHVLGAMQKAVKENASEMAPYTAYGQSTRPAQPVALNEAL